MKIEKIYCKFCGFTDEFEPNEFGVNYYQAVGECELCGKPTYYKKNNKPTKEIIVIKAKEKTKESD